MPTKNNKFWRKVKIVDLFSCWLWTGAKNNSGYGTVGRKKKHFLAHRYSWKLANGEIPDGMLICHKCDMKLCVNPVHLFLGTQKDNMGDALAKGRLPVGEQNHQSKLTVAIIIECGKLLEQGVTYRELAKRFNVTPAAINNALLGKSWRHLELSGFRKKRKHAKLTEEEVRQIRRIRIESSLSYKKIGELFNVSSGTIFHIIKENIWKGV